MAEAGVPSHDFSAWFGVVAPAGLPLAICDLLNQEINRALDLPDVCENLTKLGGIEIATGTPEQFGALIKAETSPWGALVKQTGATVD